MNAPTVEQLKAVVSPTDSPWTYLANLPFTQEANILYMLVIFGLLGAVVHYVVRWAKGEIQGSLWAYMVTDNPRRSVLAVIALLTELIGEESSGLFTTSDGHFVGWALVIAAGLKTGFLIDSIVNKATRPEWTPAQRRAEQSSDESAVKAVLPVTVDKP